MLACGRFVRSSLSVSRRLLSSYPSHTVVGMPALSPTMAVGTIGAWNKKVGDKVNPGDSVAEVQTDKASMAFEAQDEFYIAKFLVEEGAEVPVGAPILVSVNEAADVAAFANFVVSASAEPVAAAAVPTPSVVPAPVAAAPAPAVAVAATSATASGDRVFASPLARKLLRDSGADAAVLKAIQGTGPNGRIIADDVAAALAKGVTAPVTATTAAVTTASPSTSARGAAAATTSQPIISTGSVPGVYSDFELSDLARAVAARQTAAKQAIPHYYLSIELNLSKLLALREQLNPKPKKGEEKAESGIAVIDFIVKAASLAVSQVPDVNGSWNDTFIRRYEQVDVNLVVGTGDGLITPVIRDAGSKGLKAISKEITSFEDSLFADKEGLELDQSKLAIGTFSIHNLGVFGVKSAAPIIIPPQACALALGAITDTVIPRPGAAEGEDNWQVAPVMVVTLSCDHRVVDGAVGAQWLQAFKTLVENPTTMLL